MVLVQLSESERDFIVKVLKRGYIAWSADSVEKKIGRILNKLTLLISAEIQLECQIFIQNNGDGSASPFFFNTKEEAKEYASKDWERFSADICRRTITINGLGQIKDIPQREED